MASVLEIAKKLNKEFNDPTFAIMGDVKPNYKRMPTNALGLDYILGGGIPLGRIIEFSGLQHSGKAQPLDALVLTSSGYKRMGDIKVGDFVIGSDGKSHAVSGVYPQGKKKVYRVTFSDHTFTECCGEHLWNVWSKGKKVNKDASGEPLFTTVSLNEILGKRLKYPASRSYAYKIPKCRPVEFSSRDVLIDPYLLGCLLGDGHISDYSLQFISKDQYILDKLEDILQRDYASTLIKIASSKYDYRVVPSDKNLQGSHYYILTFRGKVYKGVRALLPTLNLNSTAVISEDTLRNYCRQITSKGFSTLTEKYGVLNQVKVEVNPARAFQEHISGRKKVLSHQLQTYGVNKLSHEKFIPSDYLVNDIPTRLRVLQGLFDTDGFIDKQGHAYFYSTSFQLVKDVQFIIQSLGGLASIRLQKGKYKSSEGTIVECRDCYELYNIKLDKALDIVTLPYKVDRWKTSTKYQKRWDLRAITSIEEIGEKECQCIYVDSSEHLYLTNDFIVTHNTTAACAVMAAYQRQFPDKLCVYVDVEHSLDRTFQAKMTGLDFSKVLYVSPNCQSGEQVCDMIIEWQKSDDIGCIVLDSLPALMSAAVLENDLTKDTGMRGSMAKTFHKFFPIMGDLVAKKENLFIAINQVRDDGKTFTGIQKWKEPCGSAPNFYSSIIIRFGTRKFTLGDDMDACGAKNGEGADGFRLLYKILKNKCGSCNRGGGFMTFRYATGLDWINDLLEIAVGFGFIKRLNNVTYALINLKQEYKVDIETGEILKDEKTGEPLLNILLDEEGNELKGKKADLIEYIKTNIPFQTQYLKMLNDVISEDDTISYGSLLDARTNAEINAQQFAIDNQYVIDKSNQ